MKSSSTSLTSIALYKFFYHYIITCMSTTTYCGCIQPIQLIDSNIKTSFYCIISCFELCKYYSLHLFRTKYYFLIKRPGISPWLKLLYSFTVLICYSDPACARFQLATSPLFIGFCDGVNYTFFAISYFFGGKILSLSNN